VEAASSQSELFSQSSDWLEKRASKTAHFFFEHVNRVSMVQGYQVNSKY